MDILEIEVSLDRRAYLMSVACSLGVGVAPVGCDRNKFVSWVDCVLGVLSEDGHDLTDGEKIVVFQHLGVGEKWFGCVCESLGIKSFNRKGLL